MLPQLWSYLALFMRAAAITLAISWLALVLGACLGAVVGLARISPRQSLRWAAILYTELFRSVPIIILMFFCYFGLPLFLKLDVSPFTAATVALTLMASSLLAEVVRGGVESIASGQWDAAAALGLDSWQIMRRVVGPQALRLMLPSAVGVYISTLKDSSVASVIGYVELTKTGLLIRDSTSSGFVPLAAVAGLYFFMNYVISRFGAALERRVKLIGH
jgi:His/Glu/Gln/Arg/opine family amino acid ABC transporter permease subunit